MLNFLVRRLFWMIPTMAAMSFLSFVIIQLPPGDFVTSYAAALAASGDVVDQSRLEVLRQRYGLDQSFLLQYLTWIGNIVLRGDFGDSFEWRVPVSSLMWSRLGYTALVSFGSLIFIWAIAFPVGIYSAVRKYSIGDYLATAVSFIGMATPNFLKALVLMYFASVVMGLSVGGLFSPAFSDAPWSWGRFVDLLAHLWIPVIVLGIAGAASLIRVMRANLLDELHKPYVTTARAKGVAERTLVLRYPVRVALNPFISTVGWVLPTLISGELIVSTVLNLPTAGPLLLQALKSQDMYLAGAFILFMCLLVLVGTILSDLLLAWLDPRIRLT